MEDVDDGWSARALARDRERPALISPARRRRPGVDSTILRGPFDDLGVSFETYTGGTSGRIKRDDTERIVTILMKPARGATVLP